MLEFAAKAGVSKQAIYDQTRAGKKLYPYIRKINGQKMIRADALNFYLKRDAPEDLEPETETEAAQQPADPMVSLLLERLQAADDQLKAKDQQISAQAEQIKDLTETVKAAQATQYRLQERLALLTGDSGADPRHAAADPETAAESRTEGAQEPAADPEPQKNAPRDPQAADPQGSQEPPQGGLFGWLKRLFS